MVGRRPAELTRLASVPRRPGSRGASLQANRGNAGRRPAGRMIRGAPATPFPSPEWPSVPAPARTQGHRPEAQGSGASHGDAKLFKVLDHDPKLHLHLARRLGGQAISVIGVANELLVLQLRVPAQEEGTELLPERADWPPCCDSHAVHAWRGGHRARAVAGEVCAAVGVHVPHLDDKLWPPVRGLGRKVHVDRVLPHRKLAV
eukprot:CAMPEP_0206033966 /NCGR_PEP_ID=MMETSP1466-20131121/1029_1 /ASSEMBLY_ACC=CAM_ASM_001126 /TAXON_ID=44452 /ORGANISM="Pavlova gyrans, Strain CCMP608" /LENGTH=202 /DNA_ID=CAMNT_0053408213 /DNA_START=19 /DNA_END=627 /DNA_ORIENTATION=-